MFLEHYRSQDQIQDRPDLGDGMDLLDRMGAETPASRPVVDLLVEQVSSLLLLSRSCGPTVLRSSLATLSPLTLTHTRHTRHTRTRARARTRTQVEVADVIIMNKCDQLKGDQQGMLEKLLKTLNASARIIPSTFGRVPLRSTLMPQKVHGDDAEEAIPAAVSQHAGLIDDHKAAVNLLRAEKKAEAAGEDCEVCAEDGAAGAGAAAGGGGGGDHAHGHGHGHAAKPAKKHGHGHGHAKKHGHGHGHANAAGVKGKVDTRALSRFGIDSFLYSARKPFHPNRLLQALQVRGWERREEINTSETRALALSILTTSCPALTLPATKQGLPTRANLAKEKAHKDKVAAAAKEGKELAADLLSPLQRSMRTVLRSKGFCW